jgi:shikimate kinase
MPGAGKSTIGVLLAKQLSKDFFDTDLLIQKRSGRALQEIVDDLGYLQLREIEEETILSLDVADAVIATGGSAVYSDKAMRHLQMNGCTVFLHVGKTILLSRIDNFDTRGLAKVPGQSFDDLFLERVRLYERYGELVIECENKAPGQVVREIIGALHHTSGRGSPATG